MLLFASYVDLIELSTKEGNKKRLVFEPGVFVSAA